MKNPETIRKLASKRRSVRIKNTPGGKRYVLNYNLPPLSMECYAFTGKELDKKKRQVKRTIQEAECVMAVELGRTNSKKKKHLLTKAVW